MFSGKRVLIRLLSTSIQSTRSVRRDQISGLGRRPHRSSSFPQSSLPPPHSRLYYRRTNFTSESTFWWWTKFTFCTPGANLFVWHSNISDPCATGFDRNLSWWVPLQRCSTGTRQTTSGHSSSSTPTRLSSTSRTFGVTSDRSSVRSHMGSVDRVSLTYDGLWVLTEGRQLFLFRQSALDSACSPTYGVYSRPKQIFVESYECIMQSTGLRITLRPRNSFEMIPSAGSLLRQIF